jgi:hypothetical protein
MASAKFTDPQAGASEKMPNSILRRRRVGFGHFLQRPQASFQASFRIHHHPQRTFERLLDLRF